MRTRASSSRPTLRHPDDTGEDKELTAFLNAHIATVLSASHEPRPRCPRCGGTHITNEGVRTRQSGRLPMFECQACHRVFGRTAGTPLGEKHLKKLDLFVSLLSQPLSCVEAGERLGSLPSDIGQRVRDWRAWLRRLDPSGTWERRIRLGGRPTEIVAMPLAFEEIGAREDLALTGRLTSEFDELNSMSHQAPSCVDCGSRATRFDEHMPGAFPRFKCANCGTKFTRRRGTPFLNTKATSLERMRLFIRHLALPLSFMQVSDIVVISPALARKWRQMFVDFADQLEPGGSLSDRIRLGVEPTETTPCPYCGRTGSAQRTESGHWSCAGCGRLFSMRREVIEKGGRLQIVPDEG